MTTNPGMKAGTNKKAGANASAKLLILWDEP
jgi:hypothetical protein